MVDSRKTLIRIVKGGGWDRQRVHILIRDLGFWLEKNGAAPLALVALLAMGCGATRPSTGTLAPDADQQVDQARASSGDLGQPASDGALVEVDQAEPAIDLSSPPDLAPGPDLTPAPILCWAIGDQYPLFCDYAQDQSTCSGACPHGLTCVRGGVGGPPVCIPCGGDGQRCCMNPTDGPVSHYCSDALDQCSTSYGPVNDRCSR